MRPRLQTRFSRVDLAAALMFAAVWIYYILTARYGFCSADESYYVTVAQRILQGERPLIDEWFLGQLASIFLCLPYKLFVTVRGSTTGIILFMRYLFLAFNAWFYWEMYLRLRAYKWLALIATALFSTYVPFMIFACNYYSAGTRLLMIVCLILWNEKHSPLSLLVAGVLLSCSVLYQPGFTFLYLVFTVLVWVRFIRQKKGKRVLENCTFCTNVRAWTYVTVSVVVCAACFLAFLVARCGVRNILQVIPYLLFTDPEYDFTSGGAAWGVFFVKIAQVVQVYGIVCTIAALLIIVFSIVYACGRFGTHRAFARKILFSLACTVWIFSIVQEFQIESKSTPDSFFSMYSLPLLWLGLVCYLLCEKKNKRVVGFWIAGLTSSLCIDFFSDNALSLGSPIAYIANLVFFTDLVRELREDLFSSQTTQTPKRRKDAKTKRLDFAVRWCTKLTCICFAVWFAAVVFLENPAFPESFSFGTPLFSLPHVCTQGPYRSLHMSRDIGEDYERQLADMDTIKEKQPNALFICGLTPELYLYADLPYSAYSSWTWRKTQFLNRQVCYWLLHPDRLPECVYVPADHTYNNHGSSESQLDWIRDAFDPLCEYTAQQGQGGYILYVSQWHLDASEQKEAQS